MSAEEQKKTLLKCWKQLVPLRNLPKVIEAMPPYLVLVHEEYKTLEFTNDRYHNNRLLLFMMMRKFERPDVFRIFTKTLRENGHPREADMLEGKPHRTVPFQGSNSQENVLPSTLDMSKADIIPLQINVKFSERFLDNEAPINCYRTRSKNRGSVLIINNMSFPSHEDREGADVDEANLIELFEAFGFQVVHFRDLSAKEIEEKVTNFTVDSVYDSRPDICFMIIMSHGELVNNKTVIVGHDGHTIAEDVLIDKFTNHNCALFEDRPKILIFSVCRAPKEDRTQADGQKRNPSHQGRKYSDLLICHSTILGERSNRDIYRGAWYIELFCEVLMKHSCESDLETLLKRVDDRLKLRRSSNLDKQTSGFENQGFKTCYLHPGIYQDESGQLRRFNKF